MDNALVTSLISIAIFVALFLLFRAVILWYWKINELVRLLADIKLNTSRLVAIAENPSSVGSGSSEHTDIKP